MMTDATSEWQNDWATYMPARELKKIDILIMHGSYAVRVHELFDTIIPTSAILYRNTQAVAREVL
jgi:hypothetical protein